MTDKERLEQLAILAKEMALMFTHLNPHYATHKKPGTNTTLYEMHLRDINELAGDENE